MPSPSHRRATTMRRCGANSKTTSTRSVSTRSVEDDMRRRDFTVNAIARRLSTGEIVDPLNGRDDLEHRVLRTVSLSSFAEDPLRLVRALRFVSQLRFDVDEATLQQMRR